MREKLAKYPWYHDALPKEWETMKISIVLRGLLQDVPPAVLTDVESEEAPKIVGPSCCVCVLLTACPGCGQHGFCQRCQRACWRAGTALSDSHPSPDSKAGKWEAWEQSQCSDHSFRGEEDATEENQNEFSLGLPNTLYADSSDLENFIHRCEFFNSLAAIFF